MGRHTSAMNRRTLLTTGGPIEFLVQESYVKGPLVINRRVDTITMASGRRDIQVVGMFFVRGGKIKEWLDFDPE